MQDLSREEQIDRLAGDRELIKDLREANWSGPEWDFVANVLAEYGLGVLGGWARRGLIEARCRQKKLQFRPLPSQVWDDIDQCEDLVSDIVARALRNFQKNLLPRGQWDPARGASLTTYFVGQCLIQYCNATQRWWTAHQDAVQNADVLSTSDLDSQAPPVDPGIVEGEVLTRMVAFQLLATRPARSRRALEMSAFGYSYREIAAELDMTEAAVGMMLRRERTALRDEARRQLGPGGSQS